MVSGQWQAAAGPHRPGTTFRMTLVHLSNLGQHGLPPARPTTPQWSIFIVQCLGALLMVSLTLCQDVPEIALTIPEMQINHPKWGGTLLIGDFINCMGSVFRNSTCCFSNSKVGTKIQLCTATELIWDFFHHELWTDTQVNAPLQWINGPGPHPHQTNHG